MINANVYEGDSFDFYTNLRDKKQDAALVARLMAMDIELKQLFDSYDQNFEANSLESIVANGYIDPQKSDLTSLYSYQSATLTALRDNLTKTQTGRVVKCQNCTINDISTLDHYLPQGRFSEFVVHPKNLICCCAECNTKRNNVWLIDGERATLNHYLDVLPTQQYLFVNVDVGNDSIELEYFLENRNGIDPDFFRLLQRHYTRLDLFRRFSDASDTVITSFKNIVEPARAILPFQQMRDLILQSIGRDRLAFGHNYWQAILKLELINNDDFLIEYE